MVNFVRDLNKNDVINEMHFIFILFMSSRYLSVSLAWHHRYSLTYTDIAQYLKLIVAEPTIQTGEWGSGYFAVHYVLSHATYT